MHACKIIPKTIISIRFKTRVQNPTSLHPSIHLSLKALRKLSRPLHLSRSNSATLARRAIGDGLEGRSHSGGGADGELFAVGAADHAAGGGAGG